MTDFNPRTPVGCDSGARRLHQRHSISIHAPQWGATTLCVPVCLEPGYFNPRTPVGCDPTIPMLRWPTVYFNPRTPVGCDHRPLVLPTVPLDFNPRTPVGCDVPPNDFRPMVADFNPRTPVGCDPGNRGSGSPCSYFNPRTPVGCDNNRYQTGVHESISIHAPQWGATTVDATITPILRFQSTHPSGVRRYTRRR